VLLVFSSYYVWVRRGRDRMVVGCTSTRTFSAYQMNPKNINDWHSSATSRHCNPCSSWVAPWTYISFPIPVDICYFRSLLHHEDIPPLCRTFFGFQDELDLNISSETKENWRVACFVLLFIFFFMYLCKCFCFCRGHRYFLVFLETDLSWHKQK
jgi:hypothetical protein